MFRYEIKFDLGSMGIKTVAVELEGTEQHAKNDIILAGLQALGTYPRSYKVLDIKGYHEPVVQEVLRTLQPKSRTKVEVSDFAFNAPHIYTVKSVENDNVLGEIKFQRGPILENGVNGLTDEDLIAIVIDRLQSFQKSDYSCRQNALAITKLEEAQMWLEHRTKERIVRGVEGTHKK
jgi:hypothetical protein